MHQAPRRLCDGAVLEGHGDVNTDIRISVNLPEHPKFLGLKRIVGIGAMHHLVCLWRTAARLRPDGNLKGWAPGDIAEVSQYSGDPQSFTAALMECKWLDQTSDGYQLHDWDQWQPWVVGAPQRSEAARKAGKASAEKRYRGNGDLTDGQRTVNDQSTEGQRQGNGFQRRVNPRTPSPSPSPSPYPSPSPNKTKTEGDFILTMKQLFAGMNVDLEWEHCQAWCREHDVEANENQLIKWLKRAQIDATKKKQDEKKIRR